MNISDFIGIDHQPKLNKQAESSKELGENESMRDAQLMKKSNELEAVFLTQLIQSMEKTIPKSGGNNNTLSTMMFGSVMGDAMTSGGGIGLSKVIFASLKQMDEAPELDGVGGNDYLQTMGLLQNISTSELEND